MGLFDFLKKKEAPQKASDDFNILSADGLVGYIKSNLKNPSDENVLKVLNNLAQPDEDLEHLNENGELPWGWHTHNKEQEFIGRIGSEYSYFLNMWLDSGNKPPKEQYAALKSFVLFLEDAEKLCTQKNECVEFWFYNFVASKDYIQKRKEELNELQTNFDVIEKQYYERQDALFLLDKKIIIKLKENQGILQSEFVKTFNPLVQNDVKQQLYNLAKEGKLQRTKSGRSYILNYRD